MTGEPTPTASILTGIAAIIQAIAWPLIILVLFCVYRSKVGSLIDILALKLKHVKRLKAWQLEMEIDEIVSQTGEQAGGQEVKDEIPDSQIQAAETVSRKLNASPIAFSEKLELTHKQLFYLIEQYQQIRRDMPSGAPRTRRMNELAAKMRALAIAAHPLLTLLMSGERAGERLAAICILQVRPELGHFDWLVDRVMKEDQAFLLFHASLAILELIKSHPSIRPDYASERLREALDRVESFPGGQPDPNTIEALKAALKQLRTISVS